MTRTLIIVLLWLSGGLAFAADPEILQLHCEGTQDEFKATADRPQGAKTTSAKTFSLRIAPSTGLAQIDGIVLFGEFGKQTPLGFSVTNAAYTYSGEYSSTDPKAHMSSTLSIDRYSGIARESQSLMVVGEKGFMAQTTAGEYKCRILKDKLF